MSKSMMSGGTIAAVMYASAVSPPAGLGAVPEDVEKKAHHLKNKKGYINPWDSYHETGFRKFFLSMIQ